MARRSGGGGFMTALQAALAGVSGGLEGRAKQRADEDETKRQAAAKAAADLGNTLAVLRQGGQTTASRQADFAPPAATVSSGGISYDLPSEETVLDRAAKRTQATEVAKAAQRAKDARDLLGTTDEIKDHNEETVVRAIRDAHPEMSDGQARMLAQSRRLTASAAAPVSATDTMKNTTKTTIAATMDATSRRNTDVRAAPTRTTVNATATQREMQGLAYAEANKDDPEFQTMAAGMVQRDPSLAAHPGQVAYGIQQSRAAAGKQARDSTGAADRHAVAVKKTAPSRFDMNALTAPAAKAMPQRNPGESWADYVQRTGWTRTP